MKTSSNMRLVSDLKTQCAGGLQPGMSTQPKCRVTRLMERQGLIFRLVLTRTDCESGGDRTSSSQRCPARKKGLRRDHQVKVMVICLGLFAMLCFHPCLAQELLRLPTAANTSFKRMVATSWESVTLRTNGTYVRLMQSDVGITLFYEQGNWAQAGDGVLRMTSCMNSGVIGTARVRFPSETVDTVRELPRIEQALDEILERNRSRTIDRRAITDGFGKLDIRGASNLWNRIVVQDKLPEVDRVDLVRLLEAVRQHTNKIEHGSVRLGVFREDGLTILAALDPEVPGFAHVTKIKGDIAMFKKNGDAKAIAPLLFTPADASSLGVAP